MNNLKVRTKLILGFAVVTFLTIAIGMIGVIGMLKMSAGETDLYNNQTKPMPDISSTLDYTQRIRLGVRNLIIYVGDADKQKSVNDAMNSDMSSLDEYMRAYKETITNPEAQKVFDEAEEQYTALVKSGIKEIGVAALSGSDAKTLLSMLVKLTPSIEVMVNNFNRCIEIQTEDAEITVNNNSEFSRMMLTIIVSGLAISILIAMAFAIYISGMISAPIKTMGDFFTRFGSYGDLSLSESDQKNIEAKAKDKDEIGQCIAAAAKMVGRITEINEKLTMVANGDLTAEIAVLSEKDGLGHAFAGMTQNLNAVLSEIRAASSQVSAGSGQISQGAQELASGSSQQAASIEEFSTSLSLLQSKTQLNAENSAKSQDENVNAVTMLEESISSMGLMLEAMKGIDESSKSITKVIKVIDDIAFQTNILALNAAVEAARAGQHGKGFAVVADEVRNLASKSAAAAKETAALIEGSSERVAQGNTIVTKTNSSLEAVAVGARESLDLLRKVADASNEQARSITEINQGIEQISSVVQENSASAEQSAAAAEQMSAQATVLNNILLRFKLKQTGPEISGVTNALDPVENPAVNKFDNSKY